MTHLWEKPRTSSEWQQRRSYLAAVKEERRLNRQTSHTHQVDPNNPWGECIICHPASRHDFHICDYDGTTDDCNVTEDKGDEK